MRSIFFVVTGICLLSSCTLPGSAPEKQKPIEYPSTQSDSPADKYCVSNGGRSTVEKNPNNPDMEFIFCTLPSGEKVDAWKYMNQGTTQSGITK